MASILAYINLPISSLPQVDFPVIQVTTQLPGASAETMASLREDLGIEAGPIGSRGAGLGNLTEEQRAAMIERFQSQNPGFEPPAGGFAAGGPPPSGGAPPEGGAFPGGGSTGGFQGTPDPTRLASMANRAGRGMNNLFLDPLIQLLQERAGG
jgi:hypothetical protein